MTYIIFLDNMFGEITSFDKRKERQAAIAHLESATVRGILSSEDFAAILVVEVDLVPAARVKKLIDDDTISSKPRHVAFAREKGSAEFEQVVSGDKIEPGKTYYLPVKIIGRIDAQHPNERGVMEWSIDQQTIAKLQNKISKLP